jgi:hypothetical protein
MHDSAGREWLAITPAGCTPRVRQTATLPDEEARPRVEYPRSTGLRALRSARSSSSDSKTCSSLTDIALSWPERLAVGLGSSFPPETTSPQGSQARPVITRCAVYRPREPAVVIANHSRLAESCASVPGQGADRARTSREKGAVHSRGEAPPDTRRSPPRVIRSAARVTGVHAHRASGRRVACRRRSSRARGRYPPRLRSAGASRPSA